MGLTAGQKQRVAVIDKEWRARIEGARRKGQEAEAELQRVASAPVPNLKRFRMLIKRVANAQADAQIAAMEAKVRRLQALESHQREALARWQATTGGACGCGAGSNDSGGCGSGGGGCGSAQTNSGGGGCGG